MIKMLDTTSPEVLPSGDFAYAGYTDGIYNDYASIVKRFPGSSVLSISVFPWDDADCLDVETGDASLTDVLDGLWFSRQVKRGVKRPCFYMSASLLAPAQSFLKNLPRDSYRIWSAHYTSEHICGPKSCGYGTYDADGTQWADNMGGKNIDQSILNDDFFTIPVPDPIPAWQADMMNALPVLKTGSQDGTGVEFVHRVQSILNDVFGNNLTKDGVFGPMTSQAIKNLERRYNLPLNGTVTEKEWQVLYTGSHS